MSVPEEMLEGLLSCEGTEPAFPDLCALPAEIRDPLVQDLSSALSVLPVVEGSFTPGFLSALANGGDTLPLMVDLGPLFEVCDGRSCFYDPTLPGCVACLACSLAPELCDGLKTPFPVEVDVEVPAMPNVAKVLATSIALATGIRDVFNGPIDPYPDRFIRSIKHDPLGGGAVYRIGTGERDSDEDGVADRCDGCPGFPDKNFLSLADPYEADGKYQRYLPVDEDGDGLIDGCDNCRAVYNPLQRNCNFDSEVATGSANIEEPFTGTGDVCDSSPCGDSWAFGLTAVPAQQSPSPFLEVRSNFIATDALNNALDGAPREYRTGYRFCNCPLAGNEDVDKYSARLMCSFFYGCEVANYNLYDDFSVGNPWKRVVSQFGADNSGSDPNEAVVEYRIPTESLTRSLTSNVVQVGGQDLDASGATGVLWTHTPGSPGATFWGTLRQYTNNYYSGTMFQLQQVPMRSFSGPALANLRGIALGRYNDSPSLYSMMARNQFLTVRDSFGPNIRFDGGEVSVDHVFSNDALFALLGTGVKWVSTTDPDSWLPARGVAYVGLREGPVGVGIDHVVSYENGGFSLVEGYPSGDLLDLSDYRAFISAKRNTFWIVGKGASGTELWSRDLSSGYWADTPLPEALKKTTVLAATYSPANKTIYLLAERVSLLIPSVALFRIRNEGVEELMEWPRIVFNQAYGLVPDNSGGVYIGTSPLFGCSHTILHFERTEDDRLVPDAIAMGSGTLVEEALFPADTGVTLLVKNILGDTVQKTYDRASMFPPESWEIGGCF